MHAGEFVQNIFVANRHANAKWEKGTENRNAHRINELYFLADKDKVRIGTVGQTVEKNKNNNTLKSSIIKCIGFFRKMNN